MQIIIGPANPAESLAVVFLLDDLIEDRIGGFDAREWNRQGANTDDLRHDLVPSCDTGTQVCFESGQSSCFRGIHSGAILRARRAIFNRLDDNAD